MGKDDLLEILKEYFEDLYIMDAEKQVTVNICCFRVSRRVSYFVGELVNYNCSVSKN